MQVSKRILIIGSGSIAKKHIQILNKHWPSFEIAIYKKGNISGAWMPTVVFSEQSNIKRDIILKAFKSKNIDARVFFWPLSSFPMFKTNNKNVNSWSISERSINLPSYHDIKNKDLDNVIDVVKDLIKK